MHIYVSDRPEAMSSKVTAQIRKFIAVLSKNI